MKKEQLLLVIAIAAAALIAYLNSGLYESVLGGSLPEGSKVDARTNVVYDPQTGLADLRWPDRSYLRERRTEQREEPPVLELPTELDPEYVRLLPWPAPLPDRWAKQRERIVVVPAAAPPPENTDTGSAPEEPDDGDDEAVDPLKAKPKYDLTKVARLVKRDGTEIPVVLLPSGRLKDKPVWTILETWPAAEFWVIQISEKGDEMGRFEITAEQQGSTYQTAHLERSCLNEFHEERIRRGVRDDDRAGLLELARWAANSLSAKPGYFREAMRLALDTFAKARALKFDLPLAREIAAVCRAAFDPEREIATLQEFLAEHPNDLVAAEALANALDRVGAHGPARDLWVRAADGGSVSARIGLAENLYESGEWDAALAEFAKVQGAADRASQARGYEGEARILVHRGDFAKAQTAAERAAQSSETDVRTQLTLGAVRYYLGRFADAERAFRAAVALSRPTETRALSNLGMALVALDRLDEAEKAFRTCIEVDPLNYFDPVVGLGEVLQRRGQFVAANDLFETARTRAPHDPWVLLRLGTSKLRDDLPDAALELAEAVIKASPGCVDGLRLAGGAAAALPAPNHKLALDRLGRARDKEPQNVELLRQHVRVLIVAGRNAEARALLEDATATGTGFARRDGRSLLLLAIARFRDGAEVESVREAIDNALRTEVDDAAKEYAKALRKQIDEWDGLRVWQDEFKRSGQSLLNGWNEEDALHGITVSSVATGDDSYILVKGGARSAAEERNATHFERTEDARRIRKWEARIRLMSSDTRFWMHVYKEPLQSPGGTGRGRQGAEFALHVTADRALQLWLAGGKNSKGLEVVELKDESGQNLLWPSDGDWHTIRMVRVDNEAGRWQVTLDDRPLGEVVEITQLASARNSQVLLGFQVDAERGTNVEVRIDRVRLTRSID